MANDRSSSNVQQVPGDNANVVSEGSGSRDQRPDPSLPREERIRLVAYAMAQRRGFQPGMDTEDWLEAERQVDATDEQGNDSDGPR